MKKRLVVLFFSLLLIVSGSGFIGTSQAGTIKGVDDHVLDYFPGRKFGNMNEQKKSMTVKQFLTMTSGLDLPELGKDGHVDGAFFDKFHNAPDRVAFVLGCPIKAAQDVDELLKNYIIPSAVSSSPTEPDDKEDQHLKELTKPIHM